MVWCVVVSVGLFSVCCWKVGVKFVVINRVLCLCSGMLRYLVRCRIML